ncbi:MAG: penicillin-binding protein 1C [Polyangiaceae bacterium]|nr:penicillin-binding protein 1C [Polyangiaceae bacterium]
MAFVLLAFALVAAVSLTPLPASLIQGPPEPGLLVLDRHGRRLTELRAPDRAEASTIRLSEVSPALINALIAAEDGRFYRHPGVDVLATARAFGQWLTTGHVVSGGSTLTQQLARAVFKRPPGLWGKLKEALLALRIERELSKPAILEEYLNRVNFGPNLRGIAAASRGYLDKPAAKLDLAEAATLAAIPRGPNLYDPLRNPAAVRTRRNRILERMQRLFPIAPEQLNLALAQPVTLQRPTFAEGAEHLVRALARGKLERSLRQHGALKELRATLDLDTQRELEELVRHTRKRMTAYHGTAAAALIVDNVTAQVLAYVGSPEFASHADLGQNDGVLARRQPGSALKPFVYAAAMERLGFTAATLLPDVELHIAGEKLDYAPRNYDRRYHGPVRLRQALASSFNVPAVYTASRVGPPEVLEMLHSFGFASLDQPAGHYGAAIALGDGEVTLGELAAAYATLARGGIYQALAFANRAVTAKGQSFEVPIPAERRVLAAKTAALVTSILSDSAARAPGFGETSVLDLPFPVAAKTGTSKAFRDNWAVGYTREVTVAVWVGNFDGTPLERSSGITGAGPLFRDAMLLAMRGRSPAPLVDKQGLIAQNVCPLSGKLVGSACPHSQIEWFAPSHVSTQACDMHERVWIEPMSRELSASACPGAEAHVIEVYPNEYQSWAREAKRPLRPGVISACGRAHGVLNDFPASTTKNALPALEYPFEGARFLLDPSLTRDQQRIVFRARSPRAVPLRFFLNGQLLDEVNSPYSLSWPLVPGRHQLEVATPDGQRSQAVHFEVE